jgi:hypothetical protein
MTIGEMTFLTIRLARGTEILLFVSPEMLAWTSDAAFGEFLLQRIPGLAEHHCSKGRPGGFLDVLREGTNIAHVLEHCTLALLNTTRRDAMTIRENGFFRIYFPGLDGTSVETAFRHAIAVVSEYEAKPDGRRE